MAFNVEIFVSFFLTIVVIMDPIGNLPLFLALTVGKTDKERNAVAWQAAATSLIILTAMAAFGRQLMATLHISTSALQLSGGLLLLLVSLQLLTGHEEDPGSSPSTSPNVALVPLGVPLLAGPGAIVAVMLWAQRAGNSSGGILAFIAALLLTHLIQITVFRFGNTLHRWLGEVGTIFLTRIGGMLLAAISTQLMIDGVIQVVKEL
ncbi:MAG: MarC family protein [Actinomycetaceae bacterium]|nr:MarC family protein [Actinomycetaceae bacterium]MDY6082388.1 MarC family protein [Actinomycetaceae bacterium]